MYFGCGAGFACAASFAFSTILPACCVTDSVIFFVTLLNFSAAAPKSTFGVICGVSVASSYSAQLNKSNITLPLKSKNLIKPIPKSKIVATRIIKNPGP